MSVHKLFDLLHFHIYTMDEINRPKCKRKDKDKSNYIQARNEDWVITPFQCECCHFINIHRSLHVPDENRFQDQHLLRILFCSQRPSTIKNCIAQVKYIINESRALGKPVPLTPFEAWPVQDSLGMGLASLHLVKSLGTGQPNANATTHLQFASSKFRK